MAVMTTIYRISLLLLLSFLATVHVTAQDADDWSGEWEGAIQLPGASLDLSVSVTQIDGVWTGTMDIPMQRIDDMELSAFKIDGDSLFFTLSEVPGNAHYEGQWTEDGIMGTFYQSGQQFPLNLTREDPAAAAALQAKLDQIRLLVDSLREEAEVPGLGFGMMYQGEVQIADGFGYRNLEEEVPATANTLFAIGSSSKAFTAMGVGLLVDDGKLDWDEPVKTYLPDFELYDDFATEEMTALDLLCHRSGLPRHDYVWYGTNFTRDELYRRLQYLEPSASFRSTWQYQNLMYMTAGILTERLSGQTWEEYIEEHIFQPLGMESANFSVDDMQEADDFAYGYGEKEDEIVRLPYHNIDEIGPAGSINASVNDMLKWVELQLSDGQYRGQHFVNSSTLTKMHQPQMTMAGPLINLPALAHPSYGLGWMIYDYDGLYVVEHGGNIDGFSALVFLIPEQQLGMVFLTNRNGTPLSYLLALSITDILLDREPSDWFKLVFGDDEEEDEEEEEIERRVEGTQPQHPLADYVGTYEDPGYGEVVISQEEEQLVFTYYNYTFPLEHWHYETFAGEDEESGLEVQPRFETDRNGKVSGLYLQAEMSVPDIHFVKQPGERLSDPDFLATLTGEYTLDGGTTVEIELVGDHLVATVQGQPPYDLEPYEGTEFRLASLNGFTVEFILEDDESTALIFHQPNGHFRAERN